MPIGSEDEGVSKAKRTKSSSSFRYTKRRGFRGDLTSPLRGTPLLKKGCFHSRRDPYLYRASKGQHEGYKEKALLRARIWISSLSQNLTLISWITLIPPYLPFSA